MSKKEGATRRNSVIGKKDLSQLDQLVNRPSVGINELLEAENEAAHKVHKAKQKRQGMMSLCKDMAVTDIEIFRRTKESVYQKMLYNLNTLRIEKSTEIEKQVENEATKTQNRVDEFQEEAANVLFSAIVDVKIEVGANVKKKQDSQKSSEQKSTSK